MPTTDVNQLAITWWTAGATECPANAQDAIATEPLALRLAFHHNADLVALPEREQELAIYFYKSGAYSAVMGAAQRRAAAAASESPDIEKLAS